MPLSWAGKIIFHFAVAHCVFCPVRPQQNVRLFVFRLHHQISQPKSFWCFFFFFVFLRVLLASCQSFFHFFVLLFCCCSCLFFFVFPPLLLSVFPVLLLGLWIACAIAFADDVHCHPNNKRKPQASNKNQQSSALCFALLIGVELLFIIRPRTCPLFGVAKASEKEVHKK